MPSHLKTQIFPTQVVVCTSTWQYGKQYTVKLWISRLIICVCQQVGDWWVFPMQIQCSLETANQSHCQITTIIIMCVSINAMTITAAALNKRLSLQLTWHVSESLHQFASWSWREDHRQGKRSVYTKQCFQSPYFLIAYTTWNMETSVKQIKPALKSQPSSSYLLAQQTVLIFLRIFLNTSHNNATQTHRSNYPFYCPLNIHVYTDP